LDGHGILIEVLLTEATAADCTQADDLIKGLDAEKLIAD
jgi:transposase